MQVGGQANFIMQVGRQANSIMQVGRQANFISGSCSIFVKLYCLHNSIIVLCYRAMPGST